MQLGNVMAIASGAMRVQTDRLAESAARVARANDLDDRVSLGGDQPAADSGYDRNGVIGASARGAGSGGDVDLASERMAQLTSQRAFQANLSVLRTADEMLGSLVTQRA